MKTSRFCFGLALVGLCLSVPGSASAEIIQTSFNNWANDGEQTPMLPQGPQTVGDKTFTHISNIGLVDKNIDVDFERFVLGGPSFCDDIYNFQLHGALSSLVAGTYELRYSVTISDPLCEFNTAALDTTHIADTITATTDVYSDAGFTNSLMTTLTSLNGSTDGPHSISGQIIYVKNIITISAGGIISDLDSTFTQRPVPEPSSLALLGLGGLGLVLRLRRRSK